MKNITILSTLVIIFFIFTGNISAFSQEKSNERKYGISINPHFGFVYGQALELVYPVPTDTMNDLLSELRWDMKPVFYLGLNLLLRPKNIAASSGFMASVDFKAGLPSDSGFLENRDWQSPANDNLTDFSKHTNKTREFYTLNAAAGYSFPMDSYVFTPFLSGSWMHFAFTGRDGYGEYLWGDKIFSGDVINYQQDYLIVSAGFSFLFFLPHNFSLDLSFQMSPFTYCVAKDEHIDRKTIFMDFIQFGFYLEPAFKISWRVKKTEICLDFAYRYIGRSKGESYINIDDTGYYLSPNKAGASLSLLDTRFLVKINL